MDKNELKQFSVALRLVEGKDLGAALDIILPYVESHPYVPYSEDVKDIKENFRLMLHYMELGVEDDMRESMYNDMLDKLKGGIRNLRSDYRRRNVDFYKDAYSRASVKTNSFSEKAIRMQMEDFVSDLAMLQLESAEKRDKMADKLYLSHYSFMQALFCHIVVSELWTEEQASAIGDIILSPTVDSGDAQVVVSAMMLSVMNNFDINKFRVLVRIYSEAKDEALKQKALIAWTLSVTDGVDSALQLQIMSPLLSRDDVVRDLLDLQKQMVFCMNAENDNDIIQRDIMPTLVKNSNLTSYRLGIEDNDQELRDILDPEADDRSMEEVENKFQKMIEMQKSGADIYFGGFSQMKRFSFFYSLPNWFFPFSLNHPELHRVKDSLKRNRFLTNLMATGPFCDSDKYSFALAVVSVIDKIPSDMIEMMNHGEMPKQQFISDEEMATPAYLRRRALQDLYRFYRLYRWHNQIYNPFDTDNVLFMACSLFDNTAVSEKRVELGNFLLSRREAILLSKLMPKLQFDGSVAGYLVKGGYYLEMSRDFVEAKECFLKAAYFSGDDIRALRGMAKAAFHSNDLKMAENAYRKLYTLEPDNKSYALHYAIVCSKMGDFEQAAKILYELDYKYPESANVKRVLAWTLMGENKLEQAAKIYAKLLDSDTVGDMDLLNAGYCKWFMKDISGATTLFAEYCENLLKSRKDSSAPDYLSISNILDEDFINDGAMLNCFGITAVEMILIKRITYKLTRDK